jgi:hypothetical protein
MGQGRLVIVLSVAIATIALPSCSLRKGRDQPVVAGSTVTITATCDNSGSHSAKTGVRPNAHLVCSYARCDNPGAASCYISCSPASACGPVQLSQGQDSFASGAGTVELVPNGTCPCTSKLAVSNP